jgi:membrane protease YdiL (CAAX protease family)
MGREHGERKRDKGRYRSEAHTDTRHLLRRPWLFFALALGWSWLLWIPVVLAGASQLAFPGFILCALGGLGPPAAAILLLYRMHQPQDRRDYWRRVVAFRRIGLAWYGLIVLLPVAWNILGILTVVLFGAPVPSFERTAELLSDPLYIVPFAAVVLLFGPLPEEHGWRGYALDGLSARHSALAASLILGATWALWHWPQFFMEDSYIAEAFPIGSAILSAILFHFSTNFWDEVLAVRGEMVLYRSIWIVVLVIVIVIVWGPETLRRQSGPRMPIPRPPR